ncbi:MAG TPA: ABC transporter permease [Blastocatellia bacterium]|nr:ABC transporter permease [Blastocatellia bacterium]
MKNTLSPPLIAVFQAEVLFNLKRVAPYALMVIFSANAVLWWARGPAIVRGWAVNSDFYIVWLFGGFSFMTMPLFIALMMADPVIRDFRIGIDPLIFSKPVRRIEYLLGKFFGNFFVLVCCQACFALTALGLQAFSTPGMIVLSPRLFPYLQHFFFFVVVSSLALGAICFTVGTLTRNVKIVYGLVISFYFLFIAWQYTIKGLPIRWRIVLDPMLFNVGAEVWKGRSGDWLNQTTIDYDGYMIANRILMIGVSLVCFAILYNRFSSAERARTTARENTASIFNLAPRMERLYNESEGSGTAPARQAVEAATEKPAAIPQVKIITQGLRAGFDQFIAALGVEFRLLRAERSLIVVAPLVMLVCALELAAFEVVPEPSYSAGYASRTANSLLLFLFGVAVFYAGEAMHRDRESRIEPVLWATPAPNFVLLLSKFSTTLLLSTSLIALVALTAFGVQLYKGHAPFEPGPYLKTYGVVLAPSVVFMTAASAAMNVFLREKYLAYAVSLALGGGLYYLTGQGYNHWLYNPALLNLWTPSDLVSGGPHLTRILVHRVYWLAISALLLALALLFFERKSTRVLKVRGRLSGKAWTILAALVLVLTAIITGFILVA